MCIQSLDLAACIQELRVVEFYSGIGGLHYALKGCGTPAHVVAAIDINTTANQVYSHNFPDTLLLNHNIEGIKLETFVKLDADVFIMSPPCQPFTRQGHQKASNDSRTKSFLHIMKMLKRLPKSPLYILMENVKGFEVSDTREEFVKILEESNYVYQEFLLNPIQFGIPNSRLRYFLIAVQQPLKFPFQITKSIMNRLPFGQYLESNRKPCSGQNTDNPRSYCPVCSKTENYSALQPNTNKCESCLTNYEGKELLDTQPCLQTPCELYHASNHHSPGSTETPTQKNTDLPCLNGHQLSGTVKNYEHNVMNIKEFLQQDKNSYNDFMLPENVLKKVLLMDIAQERCNHSCCFTKGYGHYVEGTGSVLQMANRDSSEIFHQYTKSNEEERFQVLRPLGLRYFTPREISNIHYFPKDFDFPPTISTKQKYRLLGNSLNVLVVAEVMKILFASKKS